MERLLNIEAITYKRKEIDRGIILGSRPCRWTLKEKYSPCYAMEGKTRISSLSPHKSHFSVYIPEVNLEQGKQIFIVNKEYLQARIETTLTIKEIGQGFVLCDVISETQQEESWSLHLPTQEEIDTYNANLNESIFGDFMETRQHEVYEEEQVDTSFNPEDFEEYEEPQQQQSGFLDQVFGFLRTEGKQILMDCAKEFGKTIVQEAFSEVDRRLQERRSLSRQPIAREIKQAIPKTSLLDVLGSPIDIDGLVQKTGKKPQDLMNELLMLELQGKVSRQTGNVFVRAN